MDWPLGVSLFEISEVCEPSLDTPPEMAEVPVAPSFEPADICLNINSFQGSHNFSTYDSRPRPRPLPFDVCPGTTPIGIFFGFCFRLTSEISDPSDELPESPLTILLQNG